MRLEGRKERLVELVLLLTVTILWPIAVSLYALISGKPIYYLANKDLLHLNGIATRIIGISVLVYILYRQNRSMRDIGYAYSFKDIYRSVGLVIVGYIATVVLGIVLRFAFSITSFEAKNIDFLQGKITVLYVLFVLINPWFEELILRAYVISEVKWLTKNTVLAVFVSVLLQTAAHLYQGVVPALLKLPLFLVFSLYYVKTSRITPIIFAHLILDTSAMAIYSVK